ncbi:MAG: transposase [Chthoniobacterales bacterium]
MKKQDKSPLLLASIDVSASELVVAIANADPQPPSIKTHPNTATGHRQLLLQLTRQGDRNRVALESTGVYGLGVALHLQSHPQIEVMIVNPRAIKDFIRATMTRAKTDRVDVLGILDYLRRMPFVPWTPPAADVLSLQQITRRLT